MTSTKPYLVRAIYEWILDNAMTPHLVIDANYPGSDVPREFVEDGRLVLNLSPGAVRGLVIGNEQVELSARFGGVARNILFPTESVLGIFARENREGMVFAEPKYPEVSGTPQAEGAASPVKMVPRAQDKASRPKAAPNPPANPDPKTPPRGKGRGKGPTLKVVK